MPGSMMASADADWLTNPATQINWGLTNIQGRYGTLWCAGTRGGGQLVLIVS
jgi:hypothetical protein